jgi:NADPH-dependent ferric siderophore reductase
LPADSRAVVLAEVDGPADRIPFDSEADVAVTWLYRDGAEAGSTGLLAEALATLAFPAGDYYAWIACESLTAKMLRARLIADRGAIPKWVKAAGYWRRGAVAVHETHED